MKFLQTLQNIWKIDELRQKILYTLGLILVFRIGTYILLPGINPFPATLAAQDNGGIAGLLNIFAGGAFSRASILALGIMPYISASIAIQLLTIAVPYFQKLQKEGESGRRTINQITRYLTVGVTLLQGFGYLAYLRSIGMGPEPGVMSDMTFRISSMVILSAGTLFAMWIGERITDGGIGNGISILIMIGILAELPGAIVREFTRLLGGEGGGMIFFVVETAVLFSIVMVVILLVQGTRRIPIQYAKRNVMRGGRMMQAGGVRQYLPMKVNASGVMPIIFAQAIMFVPGTIASYAGSNSVFLNNLSNPMHWSYSLITFFLVVGFTYFYTALVVNPKQIADQLKKDGGFIPGVKPGRKTEEYVDNVISRITLPGSLFLGIVAILPAFAMLAGVDQNFALFFGGTSLLIAVAVILDTLQQVESHLLSRHYDGLTKSGRIKGRQGVGAAF
ncbi:MAG: preprotein translocase subunit SecY [Chitinophagales bacterium]